MYFNINAVSGSTDHFVFITLTTLATGIFMHFYIFRTLYFNMIAVACFTSFLSIVTIFHLGLACPKCDTNLNCVWNRTCSSGDVCMLLQYHNDPLTVHCSKVNYRKLPFE